ncbi:hypothetical protein SEVIR_6G050200v4 [Setaria viridis]|uniref:Uncharacterized protein n=1 Tax=Setaria viridis TaxID=4556 RepID=A0A4U6U1Z1_SETVI|nr:hypothetical protein SEVIR_6G050200v2 [Setaria viridis]TKW08822.1 hypothetical protein SEVIR_6G050200v2 [Setaria viridis]
MWLSTWPLAVLAPGSAACIQPHLHRRCLVRRDAAHHHLLHRHQSCRIHQSRHHILAASCIAQATVIRGGTAGGLAAGIALRLANGASGGPAAVPVAGHHHGQAAAVQGGAPGGAGVPLVLGAHLPHDGPRQARLVDVEGPVPRRLAGQAQPALRRPAGPAQVHANADRWRRRREVLVKFEVEEPPAERVGPLSSPRAAAARWSRRGTKRP